MTMKNAKIADFLDLAADYIEEVEGTELRKKHAAAEAKIAEIADAYETSTGEAMSEDLRQKLAQTDVAILDMMFKKANTAGGSPDSLGGPGEIDTTKVASSDPDEKFARWIMS